MASEAQEPTPAELRALMADADTVRARIQDVHERLRGTEDIRHIAHRLEDATEALRRAHDVLDTVAGDLARARTARDPRLCTVPWGVCPDHGPTLRSSGNRTWCTAAGCTRSWDYDRMDTACAEPVTATVSHTSGTSFLACKAHAADAEQRLDGATITALPPAG
ncbi:hypothetical protein [Streptomyces yaizuensis]|uniref:Uncharacterized protein n=1 Tax=Streptomyces yaizuensis TaxID=2989713 RepID=A0AA86IVM3_9ACTN|nr:hypothetical protein [Streptomyces sp. YSPA8]BDT39540.1 hypothetical protein SYYSPA8_37110 [Streptomyces sp. YSPA8]